MKDDVAKAMSMLNSIVSDRVEYSIARDNNLYYVSVHVRLTEHGWSTPTSANSKHLITAVKKAMSKAAMDRL